MTAHFIALDFRAQLGSLNRLGMFSASRLCWRCSARVANRKKTHDVVARRKYTSHAVTSSRSFRVAVIGSGPAGFYAAYRLMTRMTNSFVDMYEQLPVPFGLVRYGVAPDHPEVKNCQDKFTEVATSPRFNFIGNIALGSSLPLQALKPHYDAILFAYGASKDKELGIPGEKELKGIFSARAFVGWYNGLPEYRNLAPSLTDGEDAVIIGQGNVAMDVARALLTSVDVLRKTDMSEYALEELSKSRIKRVRVVGRRGPMQGAFTIKEVRELMQLPSVAFEPIPTQLLPPDSTIAGLPRTRKRIVQLLAKGSPTKPEEARKFWSLDFLLSPHSFHGSSTDPSQLSRVTFTRTQLDPADPFSPSATVGPLIGEEGKAIQLDMPASISLRSIGYKSVPLSGLEELSIPFDESKGRIPNDGYGRVLSAQGPPESVAEHLPGIYCAGWVKRGPTGVIASTMTDAFDTADAIAADWESHCAAITSGASDPDHPAFLNHAEGGSTGLGWSGVRQVAEKSGIRATSWRDWEEIDRVEKERGQAKGKVREKFASVEEMLAVLD